ncbi:MAG: tetratricopeptide repeat protein [Sphingomonadales bacterium]|nr:tetratricopeptide repeat protein [Sphingomonadales bacterium]MDE2169760.1 tetratricopeptide repeat protein [Sphingomonadales bacterium]
MTAQLVRATFIEGTRHHQAGRLAQARALYQRVLTLDPRQPDALNLLGMIDHADGNTQLALGRIRQAIAINPQVPGFYTNLGIVLHAGGHHQAAAQALQQALQIKPDHLAALYNLGIVQQAQGEFGLAAQTYLAALKINPGLRDVWNNLGNCQARTGSAESALHSFRRAIEIDPHYVAARVNVAGLLLTMGDIDEAERMCREILQRQPNQAEAHNTLGLALMKRNRPAEAAKAFRAALDARTEYDEAALNLGNALFELGDQDGAIAQYRSIIARSPDHAAARLALAVAAIPMISSSTEQSEGVPGDFAEATAQLEIWAASRPGALARAVGTAQPFLLAYRPQDVTVSLARFGRLIGRETALARPSAAFSRNVTKRSRLRLGIVSGQVRTHPVWHIILRGMMESLDRERFDLRLYNTGALRDAETDWAESRVDHHQRQPLSVEGWAHHISRDAPDILFYPEVGMDPVAGALAPLRLAALQVASWGHPVSTGLPSIDLYLSGEAMEPEDAASHYTEHLVQLPGTGVLTRFGAQQSRRWSGPPRQPGHIRFALCQQPMKFDPTDDALLARIAREVGTCEFWVVQSSKHPWASELLMQRLAKAFAAAGLDPAAYLRPTPWMDQGEFLGFLDEMDVMLDCPAFSGYTTAWQAIHRGTPIVTLEGPAMRQRLAAGLLRQIGRTDGVARDRDHYVALAVEQGHRSLVDKEQLRRSIAEAAPRADGNAGAMEAMQRLFLTA